MTGSTELDPVARLARDTDPPTADVRDRARAALLQRIGDAPASSEPVRILRPPRRRRRALTAAGVAAVGIAASIIAVTSIAGPTLPGGLGTEPASAEARLLALASRVEQAPANDDPSIRSTLLVTTSSTGVVTEAHCTEISFSEADGASKCDDGRNANPIPAITGSMSGLNPSTTPDEIDAVLDRAVLDGAVHGAVHGAASDPEQARRGALTYGFSQGGLRADTRAELVRRVAAIPGLAVDTGVTTAFGDRGDRYTFPNGDGTFAVTLSPEDGSVLEFVVDNVVEAGAGLPDKQVSVIGRKEPLGDLDADVRRLRDVLTSEAGALEATYPPTSLPGPSASCASPVDPTIGHIDAAAFGGWVGQHCTFRR